MNGGRGKSGDRSKEANLRLIAGTENKAAALWEYVLFSNGWDAHAKRLPDKYLNQGHGPGLILWRCLSCDV